MLVHYDIASIPINMLFVVEQTVNYKFLIALLGDGLLNLDNSRSDRIGAGLFVLPVKIKKHSSRRRFPYCIVGLLYGLFYDDPEVVRRAEIGSLCGF